jgi:hypothetical protein
LIEPTECDELYGNTQDVEGLDKGYLLESFSKHSDLVSDDDWSSKPN